jgi:hypothetical protein
MNLPDGYLDALRDELAPYGFEFAESRSGSDGLELDFTTDPDSFVRQYPQAGIAESYGANWPPAQLHLRLRVSGSDPVELVFETLDLFAFTASVDLQLRDRLNTLRDPFDHAAAVSQALALALADSTDQGDSYLE